MPTAQDIISALDLQPHPEGGFFRETYRSADTISGDDLPERYRGSRCLGTAIYYLITPDSCSAMHRIASDEIFLFHLGDAVHMLHLFPNGSGREFVLGPDVTAGQQPQVVVPAGIWQGASLVPGGSFALMSTTVAPGFDFEDFELGTRPDLMAAYPDHAERITQLTRS